MSMISAQIDELRAMAQLKKSLEKPAEARILDDAADTIRQLRDDLQRANAENAELRELVDALRYCAHEAHGICARVPVGGEKPFTCCPLYDFDTKEYRCKKLMRELGVEVDDG